MHMRIIKRDLNYYAKILFFFSITLLVYGIILDISENKKYFDPVKDFTVINGDKKYYQKKIMIKKYLIILYES